MPRSAKENDRRHTAPTFKRDGARQGTATRGPTFTGTARERNTATRGPTFKRDGARARALCSRSTTYVCFHERATSRALPRVSASTFADHIDHSVPRRDCSSGRLRIRSCRMAGRSGQNFRNRSGQSFRNPHPRGTTLPGCYCDVNDAWRDPQIAGVVRHKIGYRGSSQRCSSSKRKRGADKPTAPSGAEHRATSYVLQAERMTQCRCTLPWFARTVRCLS